MNKDREQIIIVRRKKVHGHAHHGGAWKVAFADFMTAMFAMFLVLWLVNQSSDVKSAIAGYFQDPLGRADEYGSSILPGDGAQSSSPRPIADRQITDLRRDRLLTLAETIRKEMAETVEFKDLAANLEIELTDEGLRLSLVEDSLGVFFETGSAVPRPLAAAFLARLGAHLASMPNPVVVDGYTDAVPYSARNGYTNWELSADRANAARRVLTGGALPDAQIRQVRGHADRELRHPDRPTAAANRRVTITMLFGDAEHAATRDTLASRLPAGRLAPYRSRVSVPARDTAAPARPAGGPPAPVAVTAAPVGAEPRVEGE